MVTGVVVSGEEVVLAPVAAVELGEVVDEGLAPVFVEPLTESEEHAATPKTTTARPAFPMSLRRRRRVVITWAVTACRLRTTSGLGRKVPPC